MEERMEIRKNYSIKQVLTMESGLADATGNFEAVRKVRAWLQSSSPVQDRAIDFEVIARTPMALLDNVLTGETADRSYWAYCMIHHQHCDLLRDRQAELEEEVMKAFPRYNFRSREEYLEWECKDPDSGIDLELGQRLHENVQKYRYRNWREFRQHVWGTAFNSFDNGELGYDSLVFRTQDYVPLPVYEAISKRYPEMIFTVVYAHEGDRNRAGGYRYKGGKIISQASFNEHGWEFVMGLEAEETFSLKDNIISRLGYALTKGQFARLRDFGILLNGFPEDIKDAGSVRMETRKIPLGGPRSEGRDAISENAAAPESSAEAPSLKSAARPSPEAVKAVPETPPPRKETAPASEKQGNASAGNAQSEAGKDAAEKQVKTEANLNGAGQGKGTAAVKKHGFVERFFSILTLLR